LKRIDPAEAETEMQILRKRIYLFLTKEKLVQRRATHVSQHTRYCLEQIDQFAKYVKEKIQP
jgi:hypothetical protein